MPAQNRLESWLSGFFGSFRDSTPIARLLLGGSVPLCLGQKLNRAPDYTLEYHGPPPLTSV